MSSIPDYKNISIPLKTLVSQVLPPTKELIGILEFVGEKPEDGLIWCRAAGLDRQVAEELEPKLRPLLGRKISILRVGDYWSAIEWKVWKS